MGEYRIWFEFNDGTSGEADLINHLEAQVFIPLKDKSFFKKFRLDESMGTILWDNGADFAPEYLKDLVIQQKNGGF